MVSGGVGFLNIELCTSMPGKEILRGGEKFKIISQLENHCHDKAMTERSNDITHVYGIRICQNF